MPAANGQGAEHLGGFGDPRACVHASAPKPRLICALIESPFWLICRKGETRIWVLGPPVSPLVRRRTSDRARCARRATGLSTGLVDSIQYDMESEQPAWVPELPGTRKHRMHMLMRHGPPCSTACSRGKLDRRRRSSVATEGAQSAQTMLRVPRTGSRSVQRKRPPEIVHAGTAHRVRHRTRIYCSRPLLHIAKSPELESER